MARVLVPVAEGSEELETVTIVDLLRRGGVEVVLAGLAEGPVTASRGVVIVPDCSLDAVKEEDFDMIVLPGGAGGAKRMAADPRIGSLLRRMIDGGKHTAAICAAPAVLAANGLLGGKRVTSFPGALSGVPNIDYVEDAVVTDGRLVTSRGPGTAMDFALRLITILCGDRKRSEVEEALQRPSR